MTNRSNKSLFKESRFNKSKNTAFKKLSNKGKFWDPLAMDQEKDTNKALSAIAKDLEKYKRQAEEETM